MKHAVQRLFLLPLMLLLTCAAVFAQANSTVTGIVTDQSGGSHRGGKSRSHRSGHRRNQNT